MYEERERFSWTSLFIKIIIVIIFVLFTIWLLQLTVKSANRNMSNGIDVLTDNIFSQNIDRMKEVGKSYFTTERLPQKIGEVKTLTLEDMYKKNLILEVKDKNGKACSAKKSYVAIEKLETEYQMKVYLECGEEHNFIKVIMGCYNYCDTDICEKKEIPSNKAIEYEYGKTTGGAWGPWGNWTNWSTVEVSKTDRRDVETKTVVEPYTREETVTKEEYTGIADICPNLSGYTLISNKDGVCTFSKDTSTKVDPTCPDKTSAGYTLTGRDGFTCSYRKTLKTSPICPDETSAGYELTGRDGFTCNYSKTTTSKTDPKCPDKTSAGYELTGRDGFTCNYRKTTTSKTDPKCPDKTSAGYDFVKRDGFTCNYSKTTTSDTEYELVYYGTGSGTYIPADTSKYHYVQASAEYKYLCNNTCAFQWYYIYTIYTKKYKTVTTTLTDTATCPANYTPSGDQCVKSSTTTTTDKATCPANYTPSGDKCIKSSTVTMTKPATCPANYQQSGTNCIKYQASTDKATCPDKYTPSGDKCVKTSTQTTTRSATCPTSRIQKDNKCYKKVTTTITIEDTRKVTYYRYRLRDYEGGVTDYKWSPSNNDKNLLDAGYKLTGRTREVGGK